MLHAWPRIRALSWASSGSPRDRLEVDLLLFCPPRGPGAFAYDPDATGPSDIAEYVRAIQQPEALRAGLAVYEEYFISAAQAARHAEQPLDIPVVGIGARPASDG
jgi:hypothetical protein